MNQQTLFPIDPPAPPTPAQLADQAIQRVKEHTPEEWLAAAAQAVVATARRYAVFTTDEVQEHLTEQGVVAPPEPRAWGAVMREAAKDGVCKSTNEFRKSSQTTCHGRPKTLWLSRILD